MNQLIDALLSGSTLLLFFILLINPNRANIKANRWFSAFIFCVFLLTIGSTLSNCGLELKNEILMIPIILTNYFIAPFFYLSTTYFIEPTRRWKKNDYFHFSFSFLILIVLVLTLVFQKELERLVNRKNSEITSIIIGVLTGIQILIYCVMSFIKLHKHQTNIRLFSSTLENVNLKWLEYIIVGVNVMAFVWVMDIIFHYSDFQYTVVNAVYLFGIFTITYYTLNQKEIYPYSAEKTNEILDVISEIVLPEENRKKLFSDEKLELAKIELLNLMNSKKPYLDSELNLVKLAFQMSTSTHLLSYIINTGFNENFYLFVNRYRIEEAKKQILDPKKKYLSLLGIGFEVGFNSKTVFNATFKKLTGQTPSEYKKHHIR